MQYVSRKAFEGAAAACGGNTSVGARRASPGAVLTIADAKSVHNPSEDQDRKRVHRSFMCIPM
jgi:hypothetical protein